MLGRMNFLSHPRFLTIYSGVVTILFAVTTLSGFACAPKKASFDEITVGRINIVEPDGTLRMVLSNKTNSPGLILKGKEYQHPNRKTAGVIFFNEEGTENGGLSFGGAKDKDGVHSSGHLSFDQYDQDQVFTIDAGEQNGRRQSGLGIWDRGDYPIMEALEVVQRIQKLPAAERDGELKKFRASHPGDAQRAYLGRAADRSVGLRLMDQQGRDRLRLRVDPEGTPVLQFLDAAGKVTAQLPPANGK
jgi:hypothetical protein